MAQSKAFIDASHSLNELSHALALLESENSSLRGAVDGFASENEKLREMCRRLARALGIWSDWCNRDCGGEFGCDWTVEGCTAAKMLRELGVDE